jgi:ribonuclease G
MAKELIVSVNGREKKIAIIEDDVVTEFYVERGDENQGIVGNIYKGRVMKVLPGMQSAFVDIGLERDSFLYVSDFIEEDEDGTFTEERKETRRPSRPERGRPAREVVIPEEAVAARSEEEDEAEQIALRHIEEISEEPVIEPPEDEAMLEAEEVTEVEIESPRQRRQRRLRYIEPEASEAAATSAPPAAPEVSETLAVESEAEEEPTGRRRRRGGSRRKRPVETITPKEAETAPAAEPETVIFEPTLSVIVQHEPLERIVDEDVEAMEGAMLKDAILQEKISERIHAEEYRTSILEVEPTPEVHVGSLSASLTRESDFERVSDDPIESSIAASRAEAAEYWGITPSGEPAPASSNEAPETAREETAEENELAVGETESRWHQAHSAPADAVQMAGEASEESPLEDASVQLREPSRREEFATRRGGRGRRRQGFRPRTAMSDATEETEAKPAPSEESEEESEAPASTAAPATRTNGRFHRPVISDLLREGQEILVQIAKEPIAQKGARITSHIALPGRYIVYMPTVEHIGVSRKIGTDEERQRLKRTLHQLRAEDSIPGGFIVRTAANGRTTDELREDMQYLARTWTDIRRRAERAKAPAIVHRDLDLVQRILRDQLSSDFTAIRVDNEFEYERIVDFVNRFAPKLVRRVKLYTKDTPILEEHGVQGEIDKAVKPRVWLKSGGYIVINQTEALVAIDVNTGKFVGRSNRLEDTIVKTNLEAAKEIVRQIRLRDLGGIIVLDFIDMEERRNRARVMQALEAELRTDRSPSKILQFNDFGLVAITRKRVKQSLERTLCTPCAYCGGGGMVKSAQTICYEILAESRRIAKQLDDYNEIILRVNPEVAKALRTTERDIFSDIEAHLGGLVSIKSDPTVHQEHFDIALT